MAAVIGENWDQQTDEPASEGYRRYTRMQFDALNHAIKGLLVEENSFCTCVGEAGMGRIPPTSHLVDLMLAVNCDFEARQRPPRT